MPPLLNYFEFGVHKPNSLLSTHADDYDAVLKADHNIMLQSGNGASALYVQKNTNKVGISNSAPSYPLDITGYTRSTTGYKTGSIATAVIDASANITADTGYFSGNLTVDTNTFFVDTSNNNVGVGTNTPDTLYKLHVHGDTRIEGNITVNGTTTIVETDDCVKNSNCVCSFSNKV